MVLKQHFAHFDRRRSAPAICPRWAVAVVVAVADPDPITINCCKPHENMTWWTLASRNAQNVVCCLSTIFGQ